MRYIEKDETHIDNNNLTNVQKLLIAKGYLYSPLYPTYYWKLIATIYYILFRHEMKPVIFNNKKSLKDIYKSYCENYKPFRNLDSVISIIYSDLENIYESHVVSNFSFLSQIDFNDFYGSIENFKEENKEYVCFPQINYEFMEKESLHDFYHIIDRRFKNNRINVILILRKITNGYYKFNIDDLKLVIDVCNCFFNNSHIINSIFFFNDTNDEILSLLGYKEIKRTIDYYVKNCHENGLFNIISLVNKRNYLLISKECKCINMFRQIFFNYDDSYDKLESFRIFIYNKIIEGKDDFGKIDDICEDLTIMKKIKYELMSFYIEKMNYDAIKLGLTMIGEFDNLHISILEGVGKSSSLEMYDYFYKNISLNHEQLKVIIISNLKKGKYVFHEKFNEVISSCNNKEIINKIIPISGIKLYKEYRNIINQFDIINIVKLSIKNDNNNLFFYIWNHENCRNIISKIVMIVACKYKRYNIIEYIIDFLDFKCYINELYYDLKILKIILSRLAINNDLNDPDFQNKYLSKILTSSKYRSFLSKHLTINMSKRSYSEEYISSDEDEF